MHEVNKALTWPRSQSAPDVQHADAARDVHIAISNSGARPVPRGFRSETDATPGCDPVEWLRLSHQHANLQRPDRPLGAIQARLWKTTAEQVLRWCVKEK
ncbi:hypothetical protein NX059_009508 [Plenodomus lindquistii]|nr:hypothetical protein NX059_009508 [Plenodomus lindquistii]